MSRNEIDVGAPPERVWQVLSDPRCYPQWVVGAKHVRGADDRFPAPGTRFHHAVGWGPLHVKDHTQVLESAAPHRLVLRARARPLGTARVTLEVEGGGDGRSRVRMVEDAGDPLTRLLFNPLTHLLVRGRNTESLRRLKQLAERPPRPRRAGG
jgi:uncharacterized protein YndB with AHSA1/START domain